MFTCIYMSQGNPKAFSKYIQWGKNVAKAWISLNLSSITTLLNQAYLEQYTGFKLVNTLVLQYNDWV